MSEPTWQKYLSEALEIHQSLPVTAPYFEYYGESSLFLERDGRQCDFAQIQRAGIANFGIALTNGSGGYFVTAPGELQTAGPPAWARERTRKSFSAAMEVIRGIDRLRVVGTAADLLDTPGTGRIAVIPLITGHCYLDSVVALEEFYRLGLRISHCAAASGTWCRSYPTCRVNGGILPVLNETGREIISRMNELGIVIDTAHMADESTQAILEISSRPLIDGHTGSMDYNPYSRGHRDWVLRAIARGGGVVGIHFADHIFTPACHGPKYPLPDSHGAQEQPLHIYNRYLLQNHPDPEERMQLRKNRNFINRFYRDHGLTEAAQAWTSRINNELQYPVSRMAEHIQYLVNIMGHDHVGLGGDVNGIGQDQWPLDMANVGELPHLTAELLNRHWSRKNIEKFLCGNWLRVFRDTLAN